jgi:hypothetical protein
MILNEKVFARRDLRLPDGREPRSLGHPSNYCRELQKMGVHDVDHSMGWEVLEDAHQVHLDAEAEAVLEQHRRKSEKFRAVQEGR